MNNQFCWTFLEICNWFILCKYLQSLFLFKLQGRRISYLLMPRFWLIFFLQSFNFYPSCQLMLVLNKFLSLIGLSHEQNLRKMRFLSFVQLAEDKKEIEYAVIQREMQLEEADIEDFIIDGKRRLIFRHFVQCSNISQCDPFAFRFMSP